MIKQSLHGPFIVDNGMSISQLTLELRVASEFENVGLFGLLLQERVEVVEVEVVPVLSGVICPDVSPDILLVEISKLVEILLGLLLPLGVVIELFRARDDLLVGEYLIGDIKSGPEHAHVLVLLLLALLEAIDDLHLEIPKVTDHSMLLK